MKPITFEEVNVPEFGKPKDWDESKQGDCHALPAYVGDCGHPGQTFVITAWMPSEKDMENFKRGQPVFLQCYGGMPPVNLYTVSEDGTPTECQF